MCGENTFKKSMRQSLGTSKSLRYWKKIVSIKKEDNENYGWVLYNDQRNIDQVEGIDFLDLSRIGDSHSPQLTSHSIQRFYKIVDC